MSRLSNLLRFGPDRTARRVPLDRRRRPGVESLEGRQLLTLNFASAFGLGNTLNVGRIALDAQGDTYVTGSFNGKVSFDPNSTGGNVLNVSAPTAFVAKYSPTNTLVWVKDFVPSGAGSSSAGNAVAVDSNSGSVYVVGSFQGTVDFDPGGNTVNLTSAGSGDGYVVKLTPNGDLDSNLVKRFGGPGNETATDVKLDQTGANVYITGSYSNGANFDPGGTNKTLATATTDAYALKFSSNLGFGFASGVAIAQSSGTSIAPDAQGNVYVVGTQSLGANSNAFVAKFGSLGNVDTERTFGGPASGGTNAQAFGVVTDGANNVYVGGFFRGTGINFNATFGPGTVALDSAGGFDAYLIKLDPSLKLSWARRFGSNSDDLGLDVARDSANNIYLTGFEEGQSSFGTTGPGTTVLDTGNGITKSANAYVLEVDSNGNFVQATGATGTGASEPTSIAINGANEVAIGGFYAPPATFGTTTLQSLGANQIFVATLTQNSGGTGTGGGMGGGMGGGGTGGGGTMAAPTFVGEMRIVVGKGKHKKVVAFQLNFSGALNAGEAMNTAHYHVTQLGKKGKTNVIPVVAAQYNSGNNSVTLTLAGFKQNKPLQLMASGLTGSGGAAVAPINIPL